MISTHAEEVADMIAQHVIRIERETYPVEAAAE
jgi:hypothetical protein